ncbi:YlxR family protein [Cellulomonas sp. DKR-3]|uniref:YlxR family protein n=1 Tax=Cellulomonas fulva TaxID=2835530 RepID=A0ABS5U2X0_9CELL|nr:YlxR family protein [Cellulomonas fulva]
MCAETGTGTCTDVDPHGTVAPASGAPRGPVRTCVGCRATGPRSALLRVVAATTSGSPVLVVDVGRRMPGRGAWLHPDLECLELASRRRAFGRALRLQDRPDESAVREHLEGQATAPGAPVPTVDEGSGLEADGDPMSTLR